MASGKNAIVLAALAALVAGCPPNYIDFPGDDVPGLVQGAGEACIPGRPAACYAGPPGTEGVGLCKAGRILCGSDAITHGRCEGQTTPTRENCATPVDEDCDGLAPPCTGKVLWSKRFGDELDQFGDAVAADSAGNVFIIGTFKGAVDLGGGAIMSPDKYYDAFVAKFDPNGNHIWSRHFGGASAQVANGLAVDADGNVIVVGGFYDQIDVGNGLEQGQSQEDAYVVKLDKDGDLLWDRRFVGAGNQSAGSVSVDHMGNVLITGYFEGAIDFGDGPLHSQGGADVFVAKLSETGNVLWSKGFGDANEQIGWSVAVDLSDHVLVIGEFSGTIDFGGGPFDSQARNDVFVLKLDPDGQHLWSRDFGSDGDIWGSSVAVDGVGDVLIGGDFWGTADFAGKTITAQSLHDVFLVKLDSAGNRIWSKRFGGTKNQYLDSMTVDTWGNLVLTGTFDGEIDFGGGPMASTGQVKYSDIFLAKLDPSGSYLWSKRFGEAGIQLVRHVATDSSGDVLLAGSLIGSANFGTGVLSSTGPWDAADVYMAKFAP